MLVKQCLKKEWENLSVSAKPLSRLFLCGIMLIPYWIQTVFSECYCFCVAMFGRTPKHTVCF